MTPDRNLRYWSSRPVVARYAVQEGLTPPEEAFLARVRGLDRASLLDVGVGGGRTAAALAPRVASYRGVDYAPPLVAACRQRFAGTGLAERFEVADARDLSRYPDASFDVVLFGSNGLDYVDDAGRRRALAELARVCRPGGWCAVSSHSVGALGAVLSLRACVRRLRADRPAHRLPLALVRHLPRRAASILGNPPAGELLDRSWVLLRDDGAILRTTRTYYVAPDEMAAQCASAGFAVQDVLAPDGRSLPPADRATSVEAWLFWCLRRDPPGPVSPRRG